MKGYPKSLNTKADYEYVRTHFDRTYWEKDFTRLLDVERWFPLGEYDSTDGLLLDDTHKVDKQESTVDSETVTKYLYSELRTDKNAKIFRLGYAVTEVQEILGIAAEDSSTAESE